MLPTIGNNDGRVKNEAIDEADKADYYSFVFDAWFTQHPGNKNLPLDEIKKTVMAGGYYRADVTEEITVLSLNSMYMDAADTSAHGHEQSTESDWFEA